MTTDIGFKNTMFAYAMEYHKYCPNSLKVTIPETFLIDKYSKISETKSQKGNLGIFLNATPPALSSYVTKYNYITLPVIGNVGGEISVGDRFICQFINGNPLYGFILARC